jgi:hypothetical protein
VAFDGTGLRVISLPAPLWTEDPVLDLSSERLNGFFELRSAGVPEFGGVGI